MTNAELEERLKQIEEDLIPFKEIMHKLFDIPLIDDEMRQYKIDNKEALDKLQPLLKERIDIRWKLMPPEIRQAYIDKYADD